jgi:hypothetical protein
VKGYVVAGHVFSDAQPVEGVYMVLYGQNTKIPKNCLTNIPDLNINKDSDGKLLCLRASDSQGRFVFEGVSPGSYSIVPVYRYLIAII